MKWFNWRAVMLICICAILSFGGSFNCSFSSGDDDDDRPTTRGS